MLLSEIRRSRHSQHSNVVRHEAKKLGSDSSPRWTRNGVRQNELIYNPRSRAINIQEKTCKNMKNKKIHPKIYNFFILSSCWRRLNDAEAGSSQGIQSNVKRKNSSPVCQRQTSLVIHVFEHCHDCLTTVTGQWLSPIASISFLEKQKFRPSARHYWEHSTRRECARSGLATG